MPVPLSARVGSSLLVTVLTLPGITLAAPQSFNTALPLSEGNRVVRQQFLYRSASDDPSTMDRDLAVRGSMSVLGYGVTSDLALFGILPYLDKSLDLTLPSGERVNRGSSGLGDARLLARYTLFKRNQRGLTFRVAPFFGIDAPTGTDDRSDSMGRLPQPLQSGSGAWGPMAGVVATYQTLDYQLDAQISYQTHTRANDFQFGDQFQLDASLQYRLLPRELGSGVPGFLYGVLETNLSHRARNEINGAKDPNSGGTSLSLSPGLQYVTKLWILEALVQIPVVQDLEGTALEDDYTILAGFRVNF